MGYKIIRANQPLDLANRSVKAGDQIELDEKEAQDLIDRGLAEEGHIEGDAERRVRGPQGDTTPPRRVDRAQIHGGPDDKALHGAQPTDTVHGTDKAQQTDKAQPLNTGNWPTAPDNKMNPDQHSNK
jgi:hypothetical protein